MCSSATPKHFGGEWLLNFGFIFAVSLILNAYRDALKLVPCDAGIAQPSNHLLEHLCTSIEANYQTDEDTVHFE